MTSLVGSRQFLSLRGVAVDQGVIDAIMHSPFAAQKRITVPIFVSGAEINASLKFVDYTFEHHLDLTGAIIRQPAIFDNCVFNRHLSAQFAFFNAGPPSFIATSFGEDVDFSYSQAERVSIGFTDCQFARPFRVDGIEASLILARCHFESDLSVRDANAQSIVLTNCSVDGEIDVADTKCSVFRAPNLRAATAHQVGPIDVSHDLTLSHAQFGARVRIDVMAKRLDLAGAQLTQGGHILASQALVNLKQLSTGGPLRISGAAGGTTEPVILDMQDADAGSMAFAHVDMSRCVFYGSHDIGKVIIEPTVKFATSSRWHTSRRCIADEFAWRINTGGYHNWGWKLAGTCAVRTNEKKDNDDDTVVLPALEASQVAAVYRALRSSFEAQSDEPGAADFYYGEMEMRRHSREFGLAERVIVWLYWALSGYGLRASRAFVWLLSLIVGGAILLSHTGFAEGPASFKDSFIFAMKAVLPSLQSLKKLTPIGEFVEISLTLFGPVLFALAVLALRGRVKR